jgi:hypothetical protein
VEPRGRRSAEDLGYRVRAVTNGGSSFAQELCQRRRIRGLDPVDKLPVCSPILIRALSGSGWRSRGPVPAQSLSKKERGDERRLPFCRL